MVQSLELLLDAEAEAAVRAEWRTLEEAGLPSQSRHTGASNRPHVTLAASHEPLAPPAPLTLPLALTLGGLVVFGGRVLARLVVPSSELLAAHASVQRSAGGEPVPHTEVGAWTPHVTLARRMPAERLGEAVALLGTAEIQAHAIALRHWDSVERRVTVLQEP